MENYQQDGHRVEMVSRSELKLSGVSDVHSFNEEGILLETTLGILTVGGEDLHITKLNLEAGEVNLKGNINMLLYNDEPDLRQKGESFISKLFK